MKINLVIIKNSITFVEVFGTAIKQMSFITNTKKRDER